ncbi:unnamed protein product [Cunninghamella echinulata]
MVKLFTLSLVSTYIISTYATWIHVNKGCIVINGKPQCSGGSITNWGGGSATIYARYNGNDRNDKSRPGCVLKAHWPENYGDIYYGANDCLYTAKGGMIDGQCCENKSNLPKTVNPYR